MTDVSDRDEKAGRAAIVAGTGHKNENGASRARLIQRHCRKDMEVQLRREPSNPYDSNAISVWMPVPRFLFWGTKHVQIGYIKSRRAKSLAPVMDKGVKVEAFVHSFWAPHDLLIPRVSLSLYY
ncbi:HIRAN domain-containing protein [Achromobacter xylosoxidans]